MAWIRAAVLLRTIVRTGDSNLTGPRTSQKLRSDYQKLKSRYLKQSSARVDDCWYRQNQDGWPAHPVMF